MSQCPASCVEEKMEKKKLRIFLWRKNDFPSFSSQWIFLLIQVKGLHVFHLGFSVKAILMANGFFFSFMPRDFMFSV